MEHIFRDIAEQENGTLFIKDEIVSMGMGVRSPYTIYTIRLMYKGVKVTVHNQVGTTAIGTITCQYPYDINIPNFELETRSNFSTVFRGKKNRFRISCSDPEFSEFIRQQISNPDILKLVRKHQFEPYLTYKDSLKEKTVVTEYNLLFEDWPLVISPLLTLNKEIIDWHHNKIED
jgi:hypothetical protein